MSDPPSQSPPSLGDRLRTPRGLVLAMLAVLLVLYSQFVLRELLLFVGPLVTVAFLWLGYRFVRAHERIAAARERAVARDLDHDTDGGGSGGDDSEFGE